MKIRRNYSLKKYNSFGIDLHAVMFAEIFSDDELKNLFYDESFTNVRILILGGGSNILFTSDFDGLVIKISIPGIKIIDQDNEYVIIEAGAGVVWDDLVNYCVKNGYGGIENLSLIPGNVGAAPIQNIGAYGQELKDSFLELSGIFLEPLEPKTFSRNECGFAYRDSIFKRSLKNKFLITAVRLKLSKYPTINLSYKPVEEEIRKRGRKFPTIEDIRNIVIDIRKSKLPDPRLHGNAGSFFKNPAITIEKYEELKEKYPDIKYFPVDKNIVKIAAAWLIEKCNWKGKRMGEAGVYHKQPLVLVNFGSAAGSDILELANEIRQSVETVFGITLENEVNII